MPTQDAITVDVVTQRIVTEAGISERPVVLTAHRPNYVLPSTYNSHPNAHAFELINPTNLSALWKLSFKKTLSFHWPRTFCHRS